MKLIREIKRFNDMKNIHQWFAEYEESHRNPVNKVFHWVCVPLIFFSLIGLLWSIPHHFLSNLFNHPIAAFANYATFIVIVGLIFYLRLSFTIFLGMLVLCMIALLGSYYLEKAVHIPLWLISVVVFFLAWVGQFYGHKVEGKKPSFFKDLQFLMIGPAWVLSFLYRKLNIKY